MLDIYTRDRHIRKTDNTWWIAILSIGAILGIAMMCYGGAQDNDMWWLLATGREIVENGIPYVNPFSIYPDQAIVIQQWVPAVIDYLVYSAFGFAGIGALVLIQVIALAASCFLFARIATGSKGAEATAIVIAVVIGCASSYLSIRPQVWSMIAYVLVLCVMERYRQTSNWKLLIFLPIIITAHMNFHMSLALFDFAIAAAYLLPSNLGNVSSLKSMFSNYRRIPIIEAIAVMAAASLINPYGIDGVLYFFNSIDAASYGDYISEMGTLAPYNQYYGRCMMAMVVIGGIAVGRNGMRHADLPLTALFLLTTVMSIQHVRNVWLVSLFAFALFAVSCRTRPIVLDTPVRILQDDLPKYIVSVTACIVIACLGAVKMTPELLQQPEDTMSTPIEAANYMDAHSDGETNVFTHFNAGGYLEWRGYKVSMDARPELWNSAIAKNGQDRYYEYIDMSKENIESNEYMEGKSFDYMIVNTDTTLYRYMLGSLDYKHVLDGNGYALFEKNAPADSPALSENDEN